MSSSATARADEVVERLRAGRVIAVVRANDGEEANAIAEALAAGGLEAIELTFTTPGVSAAMAKSASGSAAS